MQNWEFKSEIEKFKKELLQNIDLDSEFIFEEVDKKTDAFLTLHGIKLASIEENENEEDI
jgi:hypothetical protein